MAEQEKVSTLLPSSRTHVTMVREDDIPSSRARFLESYPPPPILMKPHPELASVPPPQPYRVLVACDLSELSEGVLREALAFAHGHMPAELHLVTVVERAKEHYILHCDDKRRHVSREVVESLMNDLIWKACVPKGSQLEDALKNVALHICVGEPASEIVSLSREIMSDSHRPRKSAARGIAATTLGIDLEDDSLQRRLLGGAFASRRLRPWQANPVDRAASALEECGASIADAPLSRLTVTGLEGYATPVGRDATLPTIR
ncbi:MAG: universal stress protein [Polyangiaceae bacterium]